MPVNRLVPYDTYIDDSTPSPNAEFLNDWIQEGIIGDLAGTLTKQAVSVDGVGNAASSALAGQIVVGGAAQRYTPRLLLRDAPAANTAVCVYAAPMGGGVYARKFVLNAGGALVLLNTINANWTGTQFARDVAGDSYLESMNQGQWQAAYYPGGSASPWAAGAWQFALLTNLTNGNTTSAGSYLATAGNVEAGGDPASNQARLKGKQIVSTTGAAPTGTKGTALNNGGGDGSIVITGTDIAGTITATTGAAVGVVSANAISIVSFDKSYPSAPTVMYRPANAATRALANQPYIDAADVTGANFVLRIAGTPLTAGGSVYVWCYQVLG